MVIAEEGVWEVERRVVRDERGGGCMFDVSEPILQRENKLMKRIFLFEVGMFPQIDCCRNTKKN